MTSHSSFPAWRIPWTEEPGEPQSMGSQSQTCLETNTFTFTSGSETMELNIQVMGQVIFLHLLSSYHFLSRSLS